MQTLLFDIDGTLLRTAGSGLAAIGRAMKELHNVDQLPPVSVHGRTDFGIIGDLFDALGLDAAAGIDPLYRLYWEYLPGAMQENDQGHILPGVESLLTELAGCPRFRLGILTGNARVAAEIKLRHFGLEQFFDFGGYGDVDRDRNQVARRAFQAAEAFAGAPLDPETVWVLGDTVADIVCARSIGAKVLAVQTGGGTGEELVRESPDLIFEHFSDTARVVAALERCAEG